MPDKDVQSILERAGYKIAPYRLTHISKTAAKITGILSDTSPLLLNANEVELVLDTVKFLIDRGRTDCS